MPKSLASPARRVPCRRLRKVEGRWRRSQEPHACILVELDRETSMPATRVIRAPRGTKRTCKGWHQEAALRMLLNNLDPEWLRQVIILGPRFGWRAGQGPEKPGASQLSGRRRGSAPQGTCLSS